MSLVALYNWRTQHSSPKPSFTGEHVGPQNGYVFIVTGDNAGVGYELVKLLDTTGAIVYMASRFKVSVKNVCRAWGFMGLIAVL
ncbi:hypothetical protein CCHR01_01265 [Colletotrichum chrysophilum]|uniref:Uncharacterized protein n=1 Tax=Colletotrichum chrysophilum TaxID=1836956 RepID=A0AAD9EPC3_9PEZI|nr:hypothetical protein CCHR01_01265 [Colletotrichum chrysophilum]